MKKQNSGFTLIELIIVVCILGIIGAIVFGASGGCRSSATKANGEARAFGREMGLTIRGVVCMDYDTDGDGYVSCTLNTAEQGMVPIECAAKSFMSWNEGCRSAVVLRR